MTEDNGQESRPKQEPRRAIVARPASAIRPARTQWLWDGRMPLGELSLVAGKGGLGKSTIVYDRVARITQGQLEGECKGQPRSVLVVATEDSWEHTIVPRLIAVGANLELVQVVEVEADEGADSWLTLPVDIPAVGVLARKHKAAALILDPLVSRVSGALDTHRDADVRRALEPLKRLAEAYSLAVIGIIHLSKGGGTDPVAAVMGSVAFANVARSVSVVVPDPADETGRRRLLGTPKNNLGRDDLPMLAYEIEGKTLHFAGEAIETSAPVWLGEVAGSIAEAMADSQQDAGVRSAVAEAAEWLVDWLADQGGEADRADVQKCGAKDGHSIDSLKRARRAAGVQVRSEGFPRHTVWYLDPAALVTARERQQAQSVQSEQSEKSLGERSDRVAPTATLEDTAPTAPAAPTSDDLLFSDEASRSDCAPTAAPTVGADSPAEDGSQSTQSDQVGPPSAPEAHDPLGPKCPSCWWRGGRHREDCEAAS